MSSCKGNGECFRQCYCVCYNEDTDEDHLVCTCGHRTHKIPYCREQPCMYNCDFIKCKNYDICGISVPKWDMMNHPGGELGLCFTCWAYNGEMKKTLEPDNCPVCYEDKVLIELSCSRLHKVCKECWDKTTESKGCQTSCPMCRKYIGKWKVKRT